MSASSCQWEGAGGLLAKCCNYNWPSTGRQEGTGAENFRRIPILLKNRLTSSCITGVAMQVQVLLVSFEAYLAMLLFFFVVLSSSTRWVRLTTIKLFHCPLPNFLGTPRIEPWAAGCEARTLSIVLCGRPPALERSLYRLKRVWDDEPRCFPRIFDILESFETSQEQAARNNWRAVDKNLYSDGIQNSFFSPIGLIVLEVLLQMIVMVAFYSVL